jgi:alpha-tubulin suppressor-like RCC1 family protein
MVFYWALGQNSTVSRSSPVQIPGTTWSSISAGNRHSLATKTDGTLWSWGSNSNGQLGQNTTTRFSSPVQIPGTTWSAISGGIIIH